MPIGVCDSHCCVELGRLTVFDFQVAGTARRLGHFARYPWADFTTADECDQIKPFRKGMYSKLDSRLSCETDFQLPP